MRGKTVRERKREEEPAERWLGTMLSLLRGGGAALGAALLALAAAAALISAGTVPEGAADRAGAHQTYVVHPLPKGDGAQTGGMKYALYSGGTGRDGGG